MGKSTIQAFLSVLRGSLLSILICVPALALEVFVIGDEEHLWREWGIFEGIDDTSNPGWIQPVGIGRDMNVLNELYKARRLFPAFGKEGEVTDPAYKPGDARIWTPNAGFQENKQLVMLADGEKDTLSFDYFNRLSSNMGVAIYIDLGAAYPVERIKFYPLNHLEDPKVLEQYLDFDWGSHEDMYMKGYELYANDGRNLDERGSPIWHLLSVVPVNTDVVVVADSSFTPEYIRYIKLRCTSPMPFELDQIEVSGEGYLRQATFVSDIIDLGDLANFARLWWRAFEEPDTQVRVQTRVGKDKTSLRYFRMTEEGEVELTGKTDEENRLVWEELKPEEQGRVVGDWENWSPWSLPYTSPGEPLATGLRQFLQFRKEVSIK
ncbi:MAG: hypothetical protein KAV99_06955 [Candidatus Latescibacteria bacterium]|nr:hypothetical protein [Candidatus Latescibacterota bacterium]